VTEPRILWTRIRRTLLVCESSAAQSRPIVQRCLNWGACLRWYVPGWDSPSSIGGELGSIETRRRHDRYRVLTTSPTVGLDVDDSRIVESAVVILPLYLHTLLKAWYVRQHSPGRCLADAADLARCARAPFAAFDDHLEQAHTALLVALDVPSVVRKIRARELVRQALQTSSPDAPDGARRCAALSVAISVPAGTS
jgi:hypothetical protein